MVKFCVHTDAAGPFTRLHPCRHKEGSSLSPRVFASRKITKSRKKSSLHTGFARQVRSLRKVFAFNDKDRNLASNYPRWTNLLADSGGKFTQPSRCGVSRLMRNLHRVLGSRALSAISSQQPTRNSTVVRSPKKLGRERGPSVIGRFNQVLGRPNLITSSCESNSGFSSVFRPTLNFKIPSRLPKFSSCKFN
jgi:hypothetical protein